MRSVDDVLPLIFIVVSFMQTSTICAVATAPGGALGVVRVAGPDALAVTDRVFRARSGRPLTERRSHTLAFGHLVDPADEIIVDEVLVSVFLATGRLTFCNAWCSCSWQREPSRPNRGNSRVGRF